MSQVQVVMTGEEAKLWRAQQRILNQQKRMETGYKKVGQAGKKAGDQGTRAASRQSKMVNTLLGRFVALETGLRLVGEAAQFVRAETDKAISSMQGLADQRRALAQIAQGPRDFGALNRRADQLAAEFGVDRGTVREVLFSARSENFEEAVRNIIASTPAISAQAQAGVAGQIPAIFKQQVSATESIAATLQAAQASRLKFEQIARAAPGAAEGAVAAGTTPAETFALLSVLASEFKSGETAADRIKALGVKLSLSDEFKDKGIIGGVAALQAADEATRKKFLGESSELNVAFGKVADNMGLLRERTREVQQAIDTAGTGEGVVAQAVAAAMDPSTEAGALNVANRRLMQAQISREIANERQFAREGVARRSRVDQVLAAQKELGASGLQQFVGEKLGRFGELIGLPEKAVGLLTAAPAVTAISNPAYVNALINEATRDLSEASGSLNRSAEALEKGTTTNQAQSNARAMREQQRRQGGGMEAY